MTTDPKHFYTSSLFDDEPQRQQPSAQKENYTGQGIELYLPQPSKSDVAAFAKYRKDELKDLLSSTHNLISDNRILAQKLIRYREGSVAGMKRCFEYMCGSVSFHHMTKDDYARLSASLVSSIDNILALASLDSRIMKTWLTLIQNPETKGSEIEKILGRKIVVGRTASWNPEFMCELPFYPLYVTRKFVGYKIEDYEFYMSAKFRTKLAKRLLGPEILEAKRVSKLPAERQYTIENFETSMGQDIAYLGSMAMTGNPLNTNGTIGDTALKKLKKQFETPGFARVEGEWPLDRSAMLVNAFFTRQAHGGKEMKEGAGSCARYFVDEFAFYIRGPMVGMFFPEYKSFPRSWADYSNSTTVCKTINEIVRSAGEDWLNLDNLRLRYLCIEQNGWLYRECCPHLFMQRGRSKTTLASRDGKPGWDYYDLRDSDALWFRLIDFPFVVRWIRFLCAMGIVETADDPEAAADDKLEGLRYLRLTPLGRYAFGLDKEYRGVIAKLDCELDFDDINGILTISGSNCPFKGFLKSVAESIGDRRFRFSPESLLRECDSRFMLDKKIDNLSKIVDPKAHPALNSIINEARRRTRCAEILESNYTIYRLDSRHADLTRFIASNKEIRDNCILAEKSIVLVRTDFRARFTALCRSRGYLLD